MFRKLFAKYEKTWMGTPVRAEVEGLEGRRLLSGSHLSAASGGVLEHANSSATHLGVTTVQFSAAPTAVQDGLKGVAPSGATIADADTVYVRALN